MFSIFGGSVGVEPTARRFSLRSRKPSGLYTSKLADSDKRGPPPNSRQASCEYAISRIAWAVARPSPTDENESPAEVLYRTKNRYVTFKGFAGALHRERNWWFTKQQRTRSRSID